MNQRAQEIRVARMMSTIELRREEGKVRQAPVRPQRALVLKVLGQGQRGELRARGVQGSRESFLE
eukprot:7051544-Lingulodinium_polyedra.AAC.1